MIEKKDDRYLYVLFFNYTDLLNGKLRLSAPGGGVEFLSGGFSHYQTKLDREIRMIPKEHEKDVRVIVRGKKLKAVLTAFAKGTLIEKNGDRELREEFIHENGMFPKGLPKHWLSTRDEAMASSVNKNFHAKVPELKGGIDFDSGKMRLNVHKDIPGVRVRFDPAMIQRIKAQGFEGCEFQIRSILPISPNSLRQMLN